MKKRIVLVVTCLGLTLLAGCGHEHDFKKATCTEPRTCRDCGETKGDSLGHIWSDASCTEPKTCDRCGETKGDAKGHSWEDATLEAPKTCSKCGETEGKKLEMTLEYYYNQPEKIAETEAGLEELLVSFEGLYTDLAIDFIGNNVVNSYYVSPDAVINEEAFNNLEYNLSLYIDGVKNSYKSECGITPESITYNYYDAEENLLVGFTFE